MFKHQGLEPQCLLNKRSDAAEQVLQSLVRKCWWRGDSRHICRLIHNSLHDSKNLECRLFISQGFFVQHSHWSLYGEMANLLHPWSALKYPRKKACRSYDHRTTSHHFLHWSVLSHHLTQVTQAMYFGPPDRPLQEPKAPVLSKFCMLRWHEVDGDRDVLTGHRTPSGKVRME